jgi:hypothetical protein
MFDFTGLDVKTYNSLRAQLTHSSPGTDPRPLIAIARQVTEQEGGPREIGKQLNTRLVTLLNHENKSALPLQTSRAGQMHRLLLVHQGTQTTLKLQG